MFRPQADANLDLPPVSPTPPTSQPNENSMSAKLYGTVFYDAQTVGLDPVAVSQVTKSCSGCALDGCV